MELRVMPTLVREKSWRDLELDAGAVAYENYDLWEHCRNAINAMTVDELLEHLANGPSVVLSDSIPLDHWGDIPNTLEGAIRRALINYLWEAGNAIGRD